MTYTDMKYIPKCSIPREVVLVSTSSIPQVVKDNIQNISDCHVYLTVASWDGSWMYTAFNTISHTASRVTLYNVIH